MSNIPQLIVSGLFGGGIYGLISVGITLIFGVLGVVNFAHGEFLMLAMYISFWFFQLARMDPYLAAPIVVLIMFALGMLVQRFLIRPVVEKPHKVQILVTLGLSLAMQNLALVLWSGDYRSARTAYTHSVLRFANVSVTVPHLVAFVTAMCATGILYWYLQTSYVGKSIRATAQDIGAARLMGINVHRVYLLTFATGIALAGLAGVLLIPLYPVYPMVGWQFINVAFVCMVLGGLGSVRGAMLGGLTVGLIEVFAGYYLGAQFQQAAYFFVFILILMLRPSGFLRR